MKTALLEAHSEMGALKFWKRKPQGVSVIVPAATSKQPKGWAKRLYQLDRFKRSDVAKHLSKKYVPSPGLVSECILKG